MTWPDLISTIADLAVIVGVPAAYLTYRHERRKERQTAEEDTYRELNDSYLAYVRACLEHPDLDVFDIPDSEISPDLKSKADTDAAVLKREVITFTILITLFEQAFLLYANQTDRLRRDQWTGWETYIRRFGRRKNFQRAWRLSGNTYDEKFQEYMARLFAAPLGPGRLA